MRATLPQDPIDRQGCGYTFEGMRSQVLAGKIALNDAERGTADRDGISLGQALEPGRNVRRLTQGELFLPARPAHLPHDHEPCVNPHPDGEPDMLLSHQMSIGGSYGLHDPQPGTYGALRIILMRLGIPEAHQQSISARSGMPAKETTPWIGKGVATKRGLSAGKR